MCGDHDPRVPFPKETVSPKFLFDFQMGGDHDPRGPSRKEQFKQSSSLILDGR
jgi:hypothetical protein